jgi:hypothetical protein
MASGGSWIRIGAIDAHLDARTVNAIIKEALGRRAESVTQKPELRQTIGQEYVYAVTPFVPMKHGDLRESGSATTDGRVYWTATNRGYNYAAIQYETQYNNYTTPGTGPYWTEKMSPNSPEFRADVYDAFRNNIIPIIVEAFRENEQK